MLIDLQAAEDTGWTTSGEEEHFDGAGSCRRNQLERNRLGKPGVVGRRREQWQTNADVEV